MNVCTSFTLASFLPQTTNINSNWRFLVYLNSVSTDSSQTRRDSIPQPQSTSPVQASKRALPAAALAVLKNPAVQEAVIGKGIEVMGKMVDKSFENIERAQNKAADFLKKEVRLGYRYAVHD